MAIGTILSPVAYIYFSDRQIKQTETLINKSDSVTNISLKLTRKADSLAEQALLRSIKSDYSDSILTIKDTLAKGRNTKKELRAYLAMETIIIDSITDDVIFYSIKVINTGKTPAYHVSSISKIKPDGTGIYEKEINDVMPHNTKTTSLMRGNGMSFTLSFKPEAGYIAKEMISKIKKGIVDFYIYGNVNYIDVFNDQHTTRFCYNIIFSENGTYKGTSYNKYDDEY
jgi:hypothetical protein